MLKVILTKGLPASGKSTWAKNMVSQSPGCYKRVNKDDLREMLDCSHFSKHNESFVLQIRDQIIVCALADHKHVIVDDTNLDPKHADHIRMLVKGVATVEIKDFTDVPLDVCIERDNKRANGVGHKVIKRMYDQYLKPAPIVYTPPTTPVFAKDVIICDLDGTLAHLNGRSPYDASTCENDILNTKVASLLKGRNVVLMSGRQDKDREPTIRWLQANNIQYLALFMRPTKDGRSDSIVKREMFENNVAPYYEIDFVLDDRQQVVDMWRSIGLTCFQVAPGDF